MTESGTVEELVTQLNTLNNDSLTLINTKQYDQAYNILKHAELQWFTYHKSQCTTSVKHTLLNILLTIYNNIAILYNKCNDVPHAYVHIKHAHNICCYYSITQQCIDCNILLNLSTVLNTMHKRRDALQYTQQALNIALNQYNTLTQHTKYTTQHTAHYIDIIQLIIGCYHNIGVLYEYMKQRTAAQTVYKLAQQYTTQLNKLKSTDNDNKNALTAITKLINIDIKSNNIHTARPSTSGTKRTHTPILVTHSTDTTTHHTQQYINISQNDILFNATTPIPVSVNNKAYVYRPHTARPHTSTTRPHTTQSNMTTQSDTTYMPHRRRSSVVERVLQINAAIIPDVYINNVDHAVDGSKELELQDLQETQINNENTNTINAVSKYLSHDVMDSVSQIKLLSPKHTDTQHSAKQPYERQPLYPYTSNTQNIQNATPVMSPYKPPKPKVATLVVGGEYPF